MLFYRVWLTLGLAARFRAVIISLQRRDAIWQRAWYLLQVSVDCHLVAWWVEYMRRKRELDPTKTPLKLYAPKQCSSSLYRELRSALSATFSFQDVIDGFESKLIHRTWCRE